MTAPVVRWGWHRRDIPVDTVEVWAKASGALVHCTHVTDTPAPPADVPSGTGIVARGEVVRFVERRKVPPKRP